jgi:hypothetical protein
VIRRYPAYGRGYDVDSGIQPGDDDGWVHGEGASPHFVAPNTPGMEVRTIVRAWPDDETRAASPGDPLYAEDTVVTTYTRSGSVAPMTDLAVEPLPSGLPIARLHATRTAGTPDKIRVLHGETQAMLQLGADGMTFDDWTCPPNQDVPYSILAVVNGEDSDDVVTATINIPVTGIWLVDPDTERGFVLAGTDGLSVTMGSNVSVHTPAAGAALFRRTMALRGLEGSIVGRIDEHPSKTLREQYEDALWLRDRPERPLRLIMGDLNVEVAVTDLVPLFDPTDSFVDRMLHNVTFDFSATGS